MIFSQLTVETAQKKYEALLEQEYTDEDITYGDQHGQRNLISGNEA